jgi:hypothetical protein
MDRSMLEHWKNPKNLGSRGNRRGIWQGRGFDSTSGGEYCA